MRKLNLKTVGMTLVAATLFSTQSFAQNFVLDFSKGTSAVEFHAVGTPSLLKIHGKGGKAQGMFKIGSGKAIGKAAFDLNSLDTGIGLRDKHMKDKYLEVGKYPKATFELVSIKLPNPLPAGDFQSDAPFKGKLTLHGKTQDVAGVAKLKKVGSNMEGVVEFETKVQAYNIDIPSFAGVTMADDVKVSVTFNGPLQALSGQQKVAGGR